jgi:hypothetical protein
MSFDERDWRPETASSQQGNRPLIEGVINQTGEQQPVVRVAGETLAQVGTPGMFNVPVNGAWPGFAGAPDVTPALRGQVPTFTGGTWSGNLQADPPPAAFRNQIPPAAWGGNWNVGQTTGGGPHPFETGPANMTPFVPNPNPYIPQPNPYGLPTNINPPTFAAPSDTRSPVATDNNGHIIDPRSPLEQGMSSLRLISLLAGAIGIMARSKGITGAALVAFVGSFLAEPALDKIKHPFGP